MNDNDIVRVYLETKSSRKTAEITKRSKSGVLLVLRRNNIDPFPQGRKGENSPSRLKLASLDENHPRKLIRDFVYMNELYVEKKMSAEEIAELMGFSSATIRSNLRLLNIPVRFEGKLITNETIDQKLIEENRSVKRLGNYINTKLKIEWQCLKCDYIWETAPASVLQSSNCPKCTNHLKLSDSDIDERLIKTNRDIKRIGSPPNAKEKVEWQCLECNYIWKACYDNILNNHRGCPNCNIFHKNEKLLYKLLEENSFVFERQFPIRNIDKSVRPLRFDVYFPDLKLAIEYNGAQHYEPTSFFGGTDPEEDFKERQERDNHKKQFCKNNDITLFEIDGREYSNYKLKLFFQETILPLIKELTLRNRKTL